MSGFYNLTNVLVRDDEGHVLWEKIVKCSPKCEVWNGTDWVAHKGMIIQGKQYIVGKGGLYATPDTKIALKNAWADFLDFHEGRASAMEALLLANSLEPREGFPSPEYRAPMGSSWQPTYSIGTPMFMVRGNTGPMLVQS